MFKILCLFLFFQLSLSNQSFKCDRKGFKCLENEGKRKYLDCSGDIGFIKSCPENSECFGGNSFQPNYPCRMNTEETKNNKNIFSKSMKFYPLKKQSDESKRKLQDVNMCENDGYYCVMDGVHDYQFLRCLEGKGTYYPCATGTICSGNSSEPYEYNPCVTDPNAPVPIPEDDSTSSSEPQEQSSSSQQTSESSQQEEQSESSGDNTPVTECNVDGYFCVMDGIHDYQFLRCLEGKGTYYPCATGTICAGNTTKPYEYNPCVTDPNTPVPIPEDDSTSSSSEPQEQSSSSQQTSESSQQEEQSESSGDNTPVTKCQEDGYYCVMDGVHDYQFLRCLEGKGTYYPCAAGTICSGNSSEPYEYNPCIVDTNSQQPDPKDNTTSSSEPQEQSESSGDNTPVTDCNVDGYFCVMDGIHDYQFLRCLEGKGTYYPCAEGTICAGEQNEPYKFNPCVSQDQNPVEVISESDVNSDESPSSSVQPSESSTESKESSEINSSESDNCEPFVCKNDGYYCHIDGIHNGQFVMCFDTYKGYMPCATGTWCMGEKETSYDFNPCVFIDETTWFGTNYTRC